MTEYLRERPPQPKIGPYAPQLGALVAEAQRQEFLAIASTPAVEVDGNGLQFEPIEDTRELVEKGEVVLAKLDEELAQQYARLSTPGNPFDARYSHTGVSAAIQEARFHKNTLDNGLMAMLEQARVDGWSQLRAGGIVVNPGWVPDMVRSMLQRQPVEIELGEMKPGSSIGCDQGRIELGAKFASILKRVGFEYTRPVVIADDLDGDASAVQRAYDLLQRHGIATENTIPGRDFLIIPKSRALTHIPDLHRRLQRSERRMLIDTANGLLVRPDETVRKSVSNQYRTDCEWMEQKGIQVLTTETGAPTEVALSAATYLDPINTAFTHIQFGRAEFIYGADCSYKPEVDPRRQELSALLKIMGVAQTDQDHAILLDSRSQKDDEFFLYALTYMVREELARIIAISKGLDAVGDSMIPEDYFRHNYGKEKKGERIYPEDLQAIQGIAERLPVYARPGQVERAAIIGYGPSSYLALPIAAFMAEGGRIDISDILSQNIAFVREWIEGNSAEQTAVYHEFGDMFRNGKLGWIYDNCEQKLRDRATLHVAAHTELPSDAYDLVASSFFACSFSPSKGGNGFYGAIREKARIMKWDPRSLMIGLHMVGSGGWDNSGDDAVHIAASKLTTDDIKDGYRSAGLEIVCSEPLLSNDPEEKFREDYKGMYLIIARPGTSERPSLQLAA